LFSISATNIGYFSAIAAALVTQSGHVHSFEPMPHNFSQLEANVSTFKWATTYRCAVGAHDGHAIIHFSDREAGWATLLDFDIVSEPLQSQVDVVSLDCWVQRHGIRRVDFIKLDVEGGEYHALKGAMEMLRCFRPTIVSEIKPGFFTEQLYGLLFELGYNWIPFGDGILAKPLSVSATAPCAQTLPEL
jgi:FkbM family methyltransferase